MKKLAASLLVALALVLASSPASAQQASQKYGGCLAPATYGQICVGPRAGVLVTRYDFSGPLSGKFTGGFQPGAGYGVMLQSADPAQAWRVVELDVFGSAAVGGSASTIPNNFSLTGLLTVFNYVSFGAGCQWTEQAQGSAKAGIYVTGGVTLNVGGETPAEARARLASRTAEAERQAGQGSQP